MRRYLIITASAAFLAVAALACGGDKSTPDPTAAVNATAQPVSPSVQAAVQATAAPSPTAAPTYPDCKTMPAGVASSLKATPPSSDVPASLAGFSGSWEGYWGGTSASSLTVLTVTPTQLTATYTFGTVIQNHTYNVLPDGRIQNLNNAFVWSISPDRATIDGTLTQGTSVSRVTMSRCMPVG